MNTSRYAFADRALEQRRLASQAELFDLLTERVFRAAGLGKAFCDLRGFTGPLAAAPASCLVPQF
jgi:hypothetical protein